MTDTTNYFYVENDNTLHPSTTLPRLSHFYFVVRYLGADAIVASPPGDFGRLPADYGDPAFRNAPLTGLTVPDPKERWQRSARVDSNADDSSAFQMHCYDAGSFINTWTFPYVDVLGGGAHSVYGYDFDSITPQPIFDDNPATELVFQVSAEVPWAMIWPSRSTGEVPIGQLSMFAYFRDRASSKPFAVLMLLFDNRLGMDETFAPFVADDLRTPFVSMSMNSSAGFATTSPYSSSATGIPWTGLRFFRAHVTQDNFRTMLRGINDYCAGSRATPHCGAVFGADAFSEHVNNYDITTLGVLHEVFRTPDSNISMGVHIYDLGVWNFR